MLSLNPRYNLFRLCIPKEFIPPQIEEKWTEILNRDDKFPFRTPIDIINESIQGVSLPGIEDSVVMQRQTSRNTLSGRIGEMEGLSDVAYRSSANPLDLVKPSINISFKHIQGFYNYLLLYETWFYHHDKSHMPEMMPDLYLEFLNDDGEVVMYFTLFSPVFVGLDGLELSYNRVERSGDNFSVSFSGRAVDFEFGKIQNK